MMNEWQEYRLGDLGRVITGKTPSKKHPGDWGDEMPFVTPTDYQDFRKRATSTNRYLSLDF
jgi:type I restriction enzyme, S subunit